MRRASIGRCYCKNQHAMLVCADGASARTEQPSPHHAVAWGGAGDCRYFLDNERFVLSDTAPAPAKKLFVWDRWSDAVHVIGEYLPQVHLTF